MKMRNSIPGMALSLFLLLLASTAFAADEATVTSRIERDCSLQHRGLFQVIPGQVAKDFRIRRLESGHNCVTAVPVPDRTFSIRNLADDRILYSYRLQPDSPPSEPLGPLGRLVLPSGRYALSVGGGSAAACTLAYTLAPVQPPAARPPRHGRLRSHVDERCLQHCAEWTVEDFSRATAFRIIQLESGYGCHDGRRIESSAFAITDLDSGDAVYRLVRHPGQRDIERYGPLDRLDLRPGHYRVCVMGGRGAELILEYAREAGPDRMPPPERKEKPPREPDGDPGPGDTGGATGTDATGDGTEQAIEDAVDEKSALEAEIDQFLNDAERAGQALEFTDRWDDLIETLDAVGEEIHALSSQAGVTADRKDLDGLKRRLATALGQYRDTREALLTLASDKRFEDEIAPYELEELADGLDKVKADVEHFADTVNGLEARMGETERKRHDRVFEECERFIRDSLASIEGKESSLKTLETRMPLNIGGRKTEFGQRDRRIMAELAELQKRLDKLDRMLGEYPAQAPGVEALTANLCAIYPKYLDNHVKRHHGSRCRFEVVQCAQPRADNCWHFEWKGECPSDPNGFHWYPIGSKGRDCSPADLKTRMRIMEESLR